MSVTVSNTLREDMVDVNGKKRFTLNVLSAGKCPHLRRTGVAGRELFCSYASEQLGLEVITTGVRCRHSCDSIGGPKNGREISESQREGFLSDCMSMYYRTWNPIRSIDKYIYKMIGDPVYAYPEEATLIAQETVHLLDHPLIESVAMVGSVIYANVEHPVRDFDLAIVVNDMDEFLKQRDSIRELLPQIGGKKTDWFAVTSLNSTLVAIDVFSKELHTPYKYPYSVKGELKVTQGFLYTEWQHSFQALIDSALKKPESVKELAGAALDWEKNKPLWKKAIEFTKSVASGRGVDDEVYAKRHVSCHGTTPDGERVGDPCTHRRRSKRDGYYCSICGCGDKKIASLSPDPETGKSKLQFVELTCPMKKEGFSNASDNT